MKKRVDFEGFVYEDDFLNDFRPTKTFWSTELQKEVPSQHLHKENAVIDVGSQAPSSRKRLVVKVTVEILKSE